MLLKQPKKNLLINFFKLLREGLGMGVGGEGN